MFNKEIVVRCESGLHNKQATYFVQKANEFESSIWLESGSRKMNAKSLLGIMSLGIVPGATVVISADGHGHGSRSAWYGRGRGGLCYGAVSGRGHAQQSFLGPDHSRQGHRYPPSGGTPIPEAQ